MAEVQSYPFNDAAENQGSAGLVRPWQSIWPPFEDDSKRWLESDSPEFLKWRFNPAQSFDRPWRAYTRTEVAKTEQAYTILQPTEPNDPVPAPVTQDDESRESAGSKPEMIENHGDDFPSVLCQYLDDEIKKRQLPVVRASDFNYLAPLQLYKTTKPYLSRLPFNNELKRSNIVGKSYPVDIYNVRGNEDICTLDESGFEFMKLPFGLERWSDDTVQATYLPFLKNWLEDHFACERVFIYAYNFRGADPNPGDKPWKSPFFLAHCDATEASCKMRMALHFPDEVDAVLSKRYRFVNIWRSITPPDQNCPLALCDYRTITKKEYINTDVIFPHCCDEGYDIQYSPAHRWFYQKSMSTDEIVMFKLDDSADGVAKCVAHGAFNDPTANPQTPERASIEVRAIILGGK